MHAQILLLVAICQTPEAAAEIPQAVREFFDRSAEVHAAQVAKAEQEVENIELLIRNSEGTIRVKRKAELRAAEKALTEIRADRRPKTPIPDRLQAGDIGYFEYFQKVFILDNSTLLACIRTEKQRPRHNLAVIGVGTKSIKVDRVDNTELGKIWRYGGYVRVLPAEAKEKLISEFPQAKLVVVAVEPVKSSEIDVYWPLYLKEKSEKPASK